MNWGIVLVTMILLSAGILGGASSINKTSHLRDTIVLSNPSAANFTWRVLYDYTLLFNDTSVGGPFVEYTWDFNGYGEKVVYTFPRDGLYNVTHSVKDFRGHWYSVSKLVGVGFPVADFEWVADGLTVTFTDRSVDVDGEITYRGWDFTNDGFFDDFGETVTHRYSESGKYSVRLVVQDDDAHTASIIKEVTVREYTPDLECHGNLNWLNVKPGERVYGVFTVSNVGDDKSMLNWRVLSHPPWGNWSFIPDKGYDLKPSDGPQRIQVSVTAPRVRNYAFTGEVKVINMDDPSDYDTIDVTLVTSKKFFFSSVRELLESILHLEL